MVDLRSRLQDALADRYRLEQEIGRGGMAVVYLARDLKHERDVALKVLRPELSAALGPERFLREIKVAAGLTHPHILPLYDSGEAGGLLYYVMPYVQGESLRHRLEREGSLPVDEALRIAREVADALDHAHGQNIVHRDIKPENILLEAGHAVVADFGIARAISAAGGSRVTAVGIAVGTPDYMSPEQAAGGDDVDGRSDIYSLGCVLYEMLVGHPPVTGARGRDVPTVTAERPGVPLEIELAVETALALRPGDRYRSAAEFGRALSAPGVMTVSGARRRRVRRRRWAASLAGGLALGAVAVAVWPRLFGAGLDRSLYVVVPFGHRGGAAPRLLNGDRCELLLSQAFGRWTDVQLVDRMQVQDALLQRAGTALTLQVAKDVARRLRAGTVVWGDVADVGDSSVVTAAIYDLTRGGRTLRSASVRVHPELSDLAAKFRELADSLLLNVPRRGDVRPAALGTDVLAAWYAYAEAREALGRWDLAAAEHAFGEAIGLDPDYAHARLWLAHTLAWAGQPVDAWGPHAVLAAASPDSLGTRDRALAEALVVLAEGDYPQACERYERIVRSDPRLFAAWFGLGDCHASDSMVVLDRSSPSGWRYRSSFHAAAEAYRQALQLLPSIHRAFRGTRSTALLSRLRRVLLTETHRVRGGYAPARDTAWFAAFPALEADTLAFVPYPRSDVFAARPGTMPASQRAAVEKNRATLRGIVHSWVAAFPGSADAHELLALVLETTGELEEAAARDRSALATLRHARRLSDQPAQALRLAVAEARILLKLGQFGAARRLADSLLRVWDRPGPVEAAQLAGLAALTGRAYHTAQLLVQTASGFPERPLLLAATAAALHGYAALGAPTDSLTVLARRLEQLVGTWVEPGRRGATRARVLTNPTMWAFPHLGAPRGNGFYLLEMQRAVQQRDTATVRRTFERIRTLRRDMRPGEVAIDKTHQEARALLAVGDTAVAARLLDESLDALATLGTGLMTQVEQAAGLVRSMALRAELAAHAHDGATARRWAAAVAELWHEADNAELRAVVERMQALRRTPVR